MPSKKLTAPIPEVFLRSTKISNRLRIYRKWFKKRAQSFSLDSSTFRSKNFQKREGLSANTLCVLLQGFNRCKTRSVKGDLGDRIPNTSANIWDVTHYRSLDIVMMECKKMLLEAMLEEVVSVTTLKDKRLQVRL